VLGAVLARASTLNDFLDYALEGTDAHPALAMTGQRIMAREAVATGTRVGLDTTVDLGVALEVVLANEALATVRALELAVPEMGLHVGLDVFFAAEALVAGGEEAEVFLVCGGGAGDVARDVVGGDAGFGVGFVGVGDAVFGEGAVVERGGGHGGVGLAGEFLEVGV
jgi:hypothetical protein